MRKSQELTIRLSEARQALNEAIEERNKLPEGEQPSAELIAKIDDSTKAIRPLETELRAAITAEAGEDEEAEERRAAGDLTAEEREFKTLESKVNLGNYLSAAAEMRAMDGAEAEYNSALKIGAGLLPLRLLAPTEEEHRATTDTDTAKVPRRWLDRLFAGTAGQALGLTYEAAPAGVMTYPVTTAGGSPAQRGREEAAGPAAWTVGTTDLKPTRHAVHLQFAVEDAARLPGLEDALRRDMRAAMVESIDHAIFAGDAGANENTADIAAITATAGITEAELPQADKAAYDKALAAFVDLLDGKHAESLSDLQMVGFVGLNKLWRSTIANSAAANDTLASFLNANGLNWRTRGGIEDGTADGDLGAMIGLGRGLPGAGVVATWEGASLIRDPYSGAAKGQIQLTLTTLWNYAIVRASNFAKLSFAA